MTHRLPTPADITAVTSRCVPGQLGTQAYSEASVVLISPTGAFGEKPESPQIDLVSNKRPGTPGAMKVLVWTPYAIAAGFPKSNPSGSGAIDEQFTVKVHCNGGVQEIPAVFVTGPQGSKYPPTHPPTH